ncbi:MAG: hypothetical protein JSW00_01455 [Thermoplasmata archaeon]|nr:MAG: hypothetical protein JSW00_01455 [Thermoplasmata archaeon]
MEDSVAFVANLMALSAKTAPKGKGEDFLEIKVLLGNEKDEVAKQMLIIADERKLPLFTRDGNNVKDSQALLLVGLKEHKSAGLNCAACGFESCEEFDRAQCEGDFVGPNCAIRLLDLGIALGSAVKTASIHNVDNRIMYRVGVAIRRLGIMESNYVMGVPLSVSSKSIFFDRKT